MPKPTWRASRGRSRAANCPDKARKNHLEYCPGATTFRSQHRSRVAGPVDTPRVITGGGQSSQSESPPRVKGSKTQVQLSAMAERAALLPTAKRTKA